MIKPEKLYAATDNGLRIIALHYPEAPEAARTNKAFKARPDERTPSARIKLFPYKGGSVYKLTDFGGEGRAIDPIQIHMEARGLSFSEAILDLAAIFNISDEINRTVNRPDIERRPARANEPDGFCDWDTDQAFSARECEIMGPRVTAAHLAALHWYRVKRVVNVRNREAVVKSANEHYPIFMRECWFTGSDGKADRFYKVYEPLNPDKQWRFQYYPKGKKPQHYINGLHELAAAWSEFNEQQAKDFANDPANDGKTYKEQKLPEAVICSGERDAVCVRSLGYHPLWFNSETYKLSEAEYRQITRYVAQLYNIPDIDATGRRKGSELALRFIDIRTIWLPDKLSQYRDNRGNPRKDFRDWMEIWREPSDFRNLLELADPAKFFKTTRNNRTGELRYSIKLSYLYEFLRLNGFYNYCDPHSKSKMLVQIANHIVRKVDARDIRNFVRLWTLETARPSDLRDLVLTTPYLSAQSLEALPEITLDFSDFTPGSQLFHFPKFSVEITAENMVRKDTVAGHYVWADDVFPHDISLLPPMFEITRHGNSAADFDIIVKPHASNYFNFLINSSRLYWRTELEIASSEMAADEAEAYRTAHRFDIAGPRLTPRQIQEQKQCLISKIFAIGYLLHRYKDPLRAWAPFAMDNIIGDNDQCNGRSGKSFMFVALSRLISYVKLSGRNPKLMENPFVFEQVTGNTDMVLVDDCAEYLPIKEFYDSISMDLTINAKNVASYTLPFSRSPKFVFTTNYVPKEFNQSSRQRMLYLTFSDYYHQRTEENDYLETRQIRDDFGKVLLTETYSEAEWNADINFMMQCVRFYLSIADTNIKIEPQLDSIIFRKNLREMSDTFKEWAEFYFAEGGDKLDCEVVREDAFNEYRRYSGISKITMQRFSKSLKGFCYTCGYIDSLNPADRTNSGDRIIRRVENPYTHRREVKEMIYLRTVKEAERMKQNPPQQKSLVFEN